MKNVFIGGVSRSGKSTLAQKLYHELHYSVFEFDTVVHALTKVFPNLGISEKNKKEMDKNFTPLAFEMLKCCEKDLKFGGIKMAINGFQLLPETLAKYPNIDNLEVIFLGMSDISREEFLKNLRATQTQGDWTENYSDEKILLLADELISRSKVIKEQCAKLGFPYFDTSFQREQVLNSIVEYIKVNSCSKSKKM